MAFFLGLILGVAAAIGLVFVYARSEKSRSERRSELAATLAAFAKMTVDDSKKILPAEFYPSWIVFSRRQKLKWLNVQLIKIWPYVNEAASELIKSSVEPILEQYRSAILDSLTFSKFTLGTIAPQFTGVSIIEDDGSGITMELEVQWDGNPSIILDIQTKLGVALPIQVKNINFTGVFRIMFKPLVEVFPCFGAISYSLREKKKLDFTLKVIGGEISSIPGISNAIEETIRDAVEDSITWPVRKVIPIVAGDYSDLELKPEGRLEVKLVQAKNLTNKDFFGKSDPFAKLYIRPLRSRTKTSKTINNDLNPIWNEHFKFVVEDVATQNLVVKIYDDDRLGAAELIGCARVSLKDLQPGKVKDVWLKLVKDMEVQRDKKDRGEVHLELLYDPSEVENECSRFFSREFSMTSLERALDTGSNGSAVANFDRISSHRNDDVIVRGVLSVIVISAEDLPPMDIMTGTSDPFVVLSTKKGKRKNKTRVVNGSLNPIWNQTFDFVVEDGLHEMLILEVYDHDTFKKDYIGRCIMTLTRVIMEEEYDESVPLDGAKSGKLNLHFKWMPLPIYRDSS